MFYLDGCIKINGLIINLLEEVQVIAYLKHDYQYHLSNLILLTIKYLNIYNLITMTSSTNLLKSKKG